MVSVTKYYRSADSFEEPDDERMVAIDAPNLTDPDGIDEEGEAALAYLRSVQQEAKSLPFAVVANIPDGAPTIPSVSSATLTTPRAGSDYDERLTTAIIDFFLSLRNMLGKSMCEKESLTIDFGTDIAESLAVADSVSIANAVEDLSEVTDVLAPETIAEWLFGLLVYLEEPLLEDTGAALQSLRRFCDSTVNLSPIHNKLQVCSVIIRHYFKQR
jgi:hypothetical protein